MEKKILDMQNTFILGPNQTIGIPNSNVKKVDRKLKSFLISLSLTELGNNQQENKKNIIFKFFQKWKNGESTDEILFEISKSIKTDNYESIISDILEKIDSDLKQHIRSVSAYQSFKTSHLGGEEEQKNNFLESNKNGSIIQKLFYIPKEIKIKCKCNKITYDYDFDKFLLIDLNKENNEILLKDKIFKTQKTNRNDKCKFCSKKNNKILEESFIDFPKMLIVYLEGEEINKFSLSKSNFFPNDMVKNISYSLTIFIELNTNLVYFKIKNNWYNYTENSIFEQANYIEKKKPIILIYTLLNNKYNSVKNKSINTNESKSNSNMYKFLFNDKNSQQRNNSLSNDKIYNIDNSMNNNINKEKEINNMNQNMNNKSNKINNFNNYINNDSNKSNNNNINNILSNDINNNLNLNDK